ncbi:MAG: thermonuclease family protein [Vicinamibacteria bacterium]|nr:thermonuclease family protein [Vicinamibacteria bacterium]
MIDRRRLVVALALFLVVAAPAFADERGVVKWVIDGDTLRVRLGGRIATVRLIGVDAPETGHYRQAEPFHAQATACAVRLAKRRRVRLERDPITDDRDKYGRLLRYVWLPDGRLLNAEIIAAGCAKVMRRFEYVRQDEFREHERRARREKKGIWASSRHD